MHTLFTAYPLAIFGAAVVAFVIFAAALAAR